MDQSETSVGDSSSKEVKFEIMIKLEDDVETVHMDKDGTRKLKCPQCDFCVKCRSDLNKHTRGHECKKANEHTAINRDTSHDDDHALVDEKNNLVHLKELDDVNEEKAVGFKIADFSRSLVPNILNNNEKDNIAIVLNSPPEVHEYYEYTDPNVDEEDDKKRLTLGNQIKLDIF